MDFKDYLTVISRRKWLVVVPVLLGTALAFALNKLTEPVYRASARIEIQRESTRSLLTGQETDNRGYQTDNLEMFTTAQMITSRELLGRVVVALRGREGAIEPRVRGLDLNRQVDWLLDRITVEPIHDTRLVNIYVEHSDPKRAEEIADLVAWYFAQYQARQKADGAAGLVTYLNEQLAQVKEKINRSERMLLSTEQGDPYTLGERLKQLSAAVAEQQKSLTASNRELARAREVYKEHHPRLITLQTENETIRQSISANEREMKTVNESLQRYSLAESELKSDRDLHSMLMAKLQEAQIDGRVQKPLVQLVQPAAAGRNPVRPKKALNLAVCLLAGFLAGVGLAFMREYFRRTIRTPDDVTQQLELPVLGMIPRIAQP
jgi:uncharacterized protein involved in exopolysaccharide biosynthesis